jgi:multidrug resistance efflux pump
MGLFAHEFPQQSFGSPPVAAALRQSIKHEAILVNGAQFALLPPENATGNFVKVVQRVTVKMTFDDPGEAMQWIAPGMSVETTITIAERPGWLSWMDWR